MTTPAERLAALHVLEDSIKACTACTAQRPVDKGQRVVGSGPLEARLVIIGEAPGAEEEQAGAPFLGPAGRTLDSWLACAGIDRATARVMNAVACRPTEPGVRQGTERNRTPTGPEQTACRRHAIAQLRILAPWAIVCFGERALRIFTPSTKLVDASRATANNDIIPAGSGFEWVPRMVNMPRTPRGIRVFASYHPAYLLRLNGTDPAKAKAVNEATIDTLQRTGDYLAAMRRAELVRQVAGQEHS